VSDYKSSSTVAGIGTLQRFRYMAGLAALYLRRLIDGQDTGWVDETFAEYEDGLRRFGSGKPLSACRIVEIGFGARPLRFMALHAIGADVTAVDLDRPILRGYPDEFIDAWRRNGPARAIKSFLRFWINDLAERRAVYRALGKRAKRRGLPAERLVVASAAEAALWRRFDGDLDLIVSEDVFEHIAPDELRTIVAHMADALAPDGIAMIRPMIFTGICGGHHLEWYEHRVDVDMPRATRPWEHLRGDRHPADTYLNRMTRRDYRELFSGRFEILEESVKRPDLGRSRMTPELRAELKDWPDEELFSTAVMFVLRRRAA
jgi:hypothetical protein